MASCRLIVRLAAGAETHDRQTAAFSVLKISGRLGRAPGVDHTTHNWAPTVMFRAICTLAPRYYECGVGLLVSVVGYYVTESHDSAHK